MHGACCSVLFRLNFYSVFLPASLALFSLLVPSMEARDQIIQMSWQVSSRSSSSSSFTALILLPKLPQSQPKITRRGQAFPHRGSCALILEHVSTPHALWRTNLSWRPSTSSTQSPTQSHMTLLIAVFIKSDLCDRLWLCR